MSKSLFQWQCLILKIHLDINSTTVITVICVPTTSKARACKLVAKCTHWDHWRSELSSKWNLYAQMSSRQVPLDCQVNQLSRIVHNKGISSMWCINREKSVDSYGVWTTVVWKNELDLWIVKRIELHFWSKVPQNWLEFVEN